MSIVLILCCIRIWLQVPYFWSSAEDDSSVTMLAVIPGHQLHTHLLVAGDEKRQINIGVHCEMQTLDVKERGGKTAFRDRTPPTRAQFPLILGNGNPKKSSLRTPKLAPAIWSSEARS